MEFDEMKKIWDKQNNQPLFIINEQAMHNRVLNKKRSASHIANISELLLIIVNAGVGVWMLWLALTKSGGNLFLYLMAGWMLLTLAYIMTGRIRRKKTENKFDRSMLGDLEHALANATYQVRLSQLMRWNNLPISLFLLIGFWENGKPLWIIAAVLIFFSLVHYASGWEHNIYKSRKSELESLKRKLKEEV